MTDEELYQRYLDNDTAAADLLVQTHSDALMLYINGYLHDIHESEDLMIEAFARLFARPRPIREAGCFVPIFIKSAGTSPCAIKDGAGFI